MQTEVCLFGLLKLYQTALAKTNSLLFHLRPSETDLANLIDKLQKNADKVEKNIMETEQNLNRVSAAQLQRIRNQSQRV